MQFLEKIGDFLAILTSAIEKFITNLFGSSNDRRIKRVGYVREKSGDARILPGSVLERINSLEPEWEKLTDDELKQSSDKFRRRLADGETLDDILPEAFAAVRESSKRVLKMRHYDVQMVGGHILHNGMIAEMSTGEGKTLVATLPSYLNALAGSVHVITVNDYLALRDREWMGPVHTALGLTVGAIQSNMPPQQRQKAYNCDITYGTNNEFGFDYLRDNMKPTAELQVQGPLHFALIDEIDNILIDESRTPLIIAGPAHDDVTKYPKANKIASQLKRDEHFEVKEKDKSVTMTEVGMRFAEEIAGVDSFYTVGNLEWPHLIDNALRAHHIFKKDIDYVVRNGDVMIVDEFTGRLMEGRQWSDGLHQAVQAKEGVNIKSETQTLATITLQNYFKLYKKLGGMTGTAMTEANEFWKVYQLDVISVPTNRPMQRINYSDVIFRSEKEKWDAIAEEVRDVHKAGRPVLVGTVSIENSELISGKLTRFGIEHNVLNAKHQEREAELIAQAGRENAVTIATNMAGRGTDIILGGNPEYLAWDELSRQYESRLDVPKHEWDSLINSIEVREGMDKEAKKVAELGGLHVIGSERHDSRRIDLQLRGRAGRQGDPGSSRFFLSLEDRLMRVFGGERVKSLLTSLGMKEGEAIESRIVTRQLQGAQKRVEERHFDQRKNLLEYDEVMDEQRKRTYAFRQNILDGANCRDIILEMLFRRVEDACRRILDPEYRWETISEWLRRVFEIETEPSSLKGMEPDQLLTYLKEIAFVQSEAELNEKIEENLPESGDPESDWNWIATSRWVNQRWGLNTNDRELQKVGREDLQYNLIERIKKSQEKLDFSEVQVFLDPDWPKLTLIGWLHSAFVLEIEIDDIRDLETQEISDLVKQKLREAYNSKEIRFPVEVGLANFMSEDQNGERYDREGLVRWANGRFQSQLDVDQIRSSNRQQIENLLLEKSESFHIDESTVQEEAQKYLQTAYASANGQKQDALSDLTKWANDSLKGDLKPEELSDLTEKEVEQRIIKQYDLRYRPELRQAELSLLLEVVDAAWKDHLYYMDHLRSGIGLVGYAQKDPKVEYKKEGRKAFLVMWERIDQQVSEAIFRMEKESPGFVGSLWQISTVTHAAPEEEYETAPAGGPPEDMGRQPEQGQKPQSVEPIRNFEERVGRNDPCPCGSGKKYKKCHGA
ncbi:preprotein translocase subunit SecA [Polystyrenella longa]|uniref:Protein translocase subunit SecA n=1 Tax=Polystyrenella longa TaxID=2528007 RepID=A0A518CM07_9PLAN|nr:preprotein translocase subunit SecA [Polystyrenella longa]QDU80270.1 preprotein translocase subunit SecA [Polystyrenella longa]